MNGMRGIVQKLDKKYIKTGHEWNERDCTEVGQEVCEGSFGRWEDHKG